MNASRAPRSSYKRGTLKPPDVKPCPRCYAPMRLVDGQYECVKHGKAKT